MDSAAYAQLVEDAFLLIGGTTDLEDERTQALARLLGAFEMASPLATVLARELGFVE